MTMPRIAVLGDGIEGWLYAAIVRRLLPGSSHVTVVPVSRPELSGTVALPPEIERVHRLLRITHGSIAAIGQPRYGIRIDRPGNEMVFLPYGSLGDPETPEGFVPNWIRARSRGEAPPLADLSVNAALHAGATIAADTPPGLRRSIAAGWEIDAARYHALLRDTACALGVVQSPACHGADLARPEADIGIDTDEGMRAATVPLASGWHEGQIAVGSASQRVDAPEPFAIAAIASAAARLVRLLPRGTAHAPLAAEYNRQLVLEQDAMAAAGAALSRIAGNEGASPTLDRYIERYRIAGLLPADPQPWSADMWLLCLDAMGIAPRRYDPNADRYASEDSGMRAWATAVAQLPRALARHPHYDERAP